MSKSCLPAVRPLFDRRKWAATLAVLILAVSPAAALAQGKTEDTVLTEVVVTGTQAFRKDIREARAGMNVGLLLRGLLLCRLADRRRGLGRFGRGLLRDGDELAREGLYVDLAPWSWHVLTLPGAR